MILQILLLFILVLLNGLFAMSELALVTARRVSLNQMADSGKLGAQKALELLQSPNRFLASVQIGITLIGVLAGAIGGATLSQELTPYLENITWLAGRAQTVSLGLVVLATTYLSLVLGELVPKRLAMTNAEGIASWVAQPLAWLSTLTRPLVYLLSLSTEAVLFLLRVQPAKEPAITEDELRRLIEKGVLSGVFAYAEREIIERVLLLDDRPVSAMMVYRTDIVWIDLDQPLEIAMAAIAAEPYNRFPVARGSLDKIVGIIKSKHLLMTCLEGKPIELEAHMQDPLFIPGSAPAMAVLERFREEGVHLAIVLDEYGGVEGLVTATDLLEAIVGDLPDDFAGHAPEIKRRPDGSWLLDGVLGIEEFKTLFSIADLPGREGLEYETLGGFMMTYLDRIPSSTDHFEWGGYYFEVLDMDGHRVDKVLVVPLKEQENDSIDSV